MRMGGSLINKEPPSRYIVNVQLQQLVDGEPFGGCWEFEVEDALVDDVFKIVMEALKEHCEDVD